MSTALRTTASTDAGRGAAERIDPGWEDRRDEAAAVMCVTVVIGAGCGLLINWLDWPVGFLLALGVYLVCARLAWLRGLGGS